MRCAAVSITAWLAGAGCTWVPLEEGADSVAVLQPAEVERCEQLARTRATTARRVLFFPRRADKMREELASVARNEAQRSGGDAVAPLGEMEDGVQEFGIYRCGADAEAADSSSG